MQTDETDSVAAADLSTVAGVRDLTRRCLDAGIAAADPRRAAAERLTLDGDDLLVPTGGEGGAPTTTGESTAGYDLSAFDRVLVGGGGKAVGGLAHGLLDRLGDRIDEGVVVTTDAGSAEKGESRGGADAAAIGPVRVLPGDHPTPSERGVRSTEAVLELADEATADDLFVVLLTGGGSALLTAPAPGLTLADLRQTTDALLASGADIREINAVRKHCSAIKGGHLARRASPATVLGLAISDVVGDDLATIASGPTAPDPSTFRDAHDVLDRYGIDAPAAVRDRLRRGADGGGEETPKPGDPVFDDVRTVVLANGHTALSAAREAAEATGPGSGVETCLLTGRLRGEASVVGQTLTGIAEEVAATGNPVSPPAVLVAGGETTVTVTGSGVGGPNGELALSAAVEFVDWPAVGGETPVALGSVDTDGRDGSTDAAGALVDQTTVGGDESDRPGLGHARDALADDDSHGYLGARGALVHTGPTGTNVNDLVVLVVGTPEE
ncbi:glycerate kinase type-2 family protein [Salinirubrum litoreum]|uniref:Glycerate kinase n=1 Tax=Salinirubrum litoreum TaxID=1126234 RepID=A0ABD5R7Z2_9EURY